MTADGAPAEAAARAKRARALRTVHVITSLEEGGAQAMLLKLLGAGRAEGDVASVVTLTDGGSVQARIEALGIRVHALHMKRGRPSVAAALRLVALLRRERPDLVQTWLHHADLLGGLAARALGIPVVWGIRNDAQAGKDVLLTRLTQRACALLSPLVPARIICNSEAARSTHAQLGFDAAKLVVVPNGFDLAAFRPDPAARATIRAELGLAETRPLVGMIARFHPHKDHATFLAAAALVRARLPDAAFVLCGEDVRWDVLALAQAVDAHGLRADLHLLGKRHDVEQVTAALDVACLASKTESFPNVVGEAMACGVPCVATDCGDVRAILGGAGRVVPVGDPAALAAAIVELLGLSRAERDAMGRASRARVGALFSAAAVAQRFRDVHAQVARS